ncbi:heavy metal translocating P-type ATPase [Agathobaculum sp.]|uniref:heavy metal translocating P-type ATPase n=1 Tax=Agathobaculum sp. TaxID=2048138 RepID=UPI002A7F582F|nr:heavy metal translocating P-type ATPase [Agathobaculum sp.]MDY3618071.1 heavy metal translocating P-type ATPase [Agathobaculum sp.]
MSKDIKRSDEQPLQQEKQTVVAPDGFSVGLVDELLSDLESGTVQTSEPPIEETAVSEEEQAEELAPEETEEVELPEPEQSGLEAEPQGTESLETDEKLPPISEEFPSDQENAEDADFDGLSFIERARLRARLRRREQTRQRRENARRGLYGADVPYQAMTAVDIRGTLVRLAIAAVFLIIGRVLEQGTGALVFYLIAYLIAVLPVAVTVVRDMMHGKYFSEYLLIFLASLGAFLLDQRFEASLVLILHSIGKLINDMVLGKTRNSLSQQTDFVPVQASLVNMEGEERRVAPGDIKIGDFIIVRAGERIPIDGEVLRGEGTVDDTVLTGDSEPGEVCKGCKVLAGSLYTGTLLLIRATTRFEDCGVSQILRIHEESTGRRASLEESVIHGASRYMPLIICIAVLLAFLPPLFHFGRLSTWIYRALTVLIVCCPTALLISVPLSFLGGSGRMSQKGIQVKGSEAVEKLAELRMVVFDKTGTLTEGNLRVKEIQATADFNAESCLALAATAEQMSQHPVARAVVAAYEGIPQKIAEFEEFPGRGVRARIGNHNLLAGNRKLMISRGVKGVPDLAGTVLYLAYEGDYAGAIILEDTVRPEAETAIAGLKSLGVMRTVILTGDTELPAQQVADAIGIDTVHSGLLPEEKASKMEFLLRTIPTDGTAAYVGDGVNDLSELKLADVGVAMGVAGSAESAEAANVLIMTNDLTRFTEAVRISRQTHGVAMQNMLLLFIIKAVLVLLTLFGAATMWQAVAADVLMTVLAVLNAARTLNAK